MELLVSMGVASILIVALMQSLVSASDSWTRQSKHFSAQREGRTALRLLADDLGSITALPERGPLAPVTATEGSTPTRFLLVDPRDGSSSSRLAFLRTAKRVTQGAEAGRGDTRLVMYGVALTDDGGASGLEPEARSQKLIRREFSAAETFRRLEAHFQAGQPLVFEEDWGSLGGLGEADAAVATNTVLAHDVIRLEVKALESLAGPAAAATGVWPPEKVPAWVDATLRVTNRQTGRWLKTLMDWRGEGEQAERLTNGTPEVYHDDPEVRTFSMKLRLPAATW